jgi:hypothetical protein
VLAGELFEQSQTIYFSALLAELLPKSGQRPCTCGEPGSPTFLCWRRWQADCQDPASLVSVSRRRKSRLPIHFSVDDLMDSSRNSGLQ